MKDKIDCKWAGDMSFEADVEGYKVIMDASEQSGGKHRGPRPKSLVLIALAGCTGMDVIPILKKMKVEPTFFNISVEADVAEEHPKVYQNICVVYEFRGDNLPMEKLERAVSLSKEKYCAVSAMLRKAAVITSEIRILE
jgi:putative redox protein